MGVIAKVFPLRAVRAALRECGRASQRKRALPAEAMVYYVIAMGLFRAAATREVLRCLVDGLRWTRSGTGLRIASKVAISRARTRLGRKPLRGLRRRCVRLVAEADTRGAWYRGLRLLAYDGTTTALVELGTRAAFAWEYGPYRESERRQAERLHRHLEAGMLLLADRGYLGAALWRSAVRTGADPLWRVRCDTVLPLRQALPDGSYLSEFGGRTARVVEYTIAASDEPSYRLLTTRLDPLQAPAAELAALYHERWEIESTYDEIKTHLLGRHPILRSKTPPLVR